MPTFRAILSASVLFAAPAHADERATGIGVTVSAGGGITGFSDRTMDGVANTGLSWGARVAVGSRLPLALEAEYLGNSYTLDMAGSQGVTLDGECVAAALRFTPLPRERWSPFAFAGLGWQRYTFVGAPVDAMTSMHLSRDALVVPLGAGVQLRAADGFVFDLRGAYRAGQADTWGASATIGLEL